MSSRRHTAACNHCCPHGEHWKAQARTALQHDGARLEDLHDARHDGLEEAVERRVVRAVAHRHIDRVIPPVALYGRKSYPLIVN